jgi:hypothetical protein
MGHTNKIELFKQGEYVIVDPLYLEQIHDSIDSVVSDCEGLNLLYHIENEAFPYSGGYILGYLNIRNDHTNIGVDDFKKSTPENLLDPKSKEEFCLFTSDSGVVIICEIHALLMLSELVNYDLLFNNQGIDKVYFENVKKEISSNSLWILSTPGINNNVEFDGSGVYSCFTSL